LVEQDPVHPAPANTPNPYTSAARLDIPVLFVSGTNDCMCKAMGEDYPAYANATKSRCRVFSNVTGADHCQWAALTGLEEFACVLIEKSKGCKPDLTAQQQQAIALKYVVPFFDYVAKHNRTAWQSLVSELDDDKAKGAVTWEHEGCQ
jgi:hypothetical protein